MNNNILYGWAEWVEFEDYTSLSKKDVDRIMKELKSIDKKSYELLFKLFNEVDRQIENIMEDVKI